MLSPNSSVSGAAAGPIFALHYPISIGTVMRIARDRASEVWEKLKREDPVRRAPACIL